MFTQWIDQENISHAHELMNGLDIYASIGGIGTIAFRVIRVHVLKNKSTSTSLHNSLFHGSLSDAKQYAETAGRALVQVLEIIHPTTLEEGLR